MPVDDYDADATELLETYGLSIRCCETASNIPCRLPDEIHYHR
jgi:hypothetical protein